MSQVLPATPDAIHQAAKILKSGGLVALPTETVYGLGADASNPDAVRRIFSAKGRPADHPLIVHLVSASQLSDWATNIPDEAYALADAFMPGAITLILKCGDAVPDVVTGGQDTVGLRIPSHPVALELLQAFGGGIAAPSANRFGRISPTTAEHVAEELGDSVDLILDGGACEVGVESTIVDLSQGEARVLRPGMITVPQLNEVLGYVPKGQVDNSPRVSGSLKSHYAPTTPVTLVHPKDLHSTVEISQSFARVAVIALQDEPENCQLPWITMPSEPELYAQHIYSVLRELDALGYDRLMVEAVPDVEAWQAISDRLERASA